MDIRFGSLTTQSGQKIEFKDFDKDGDGVITEQEYNAALKEYDLDKVELSNVDKNADKTLSKDEFQLWEQKIKMEEALQPYLKKVTTDFSGTRSQYASEMTQKLHDFIDKYADEYMAGGKDVSKLAMAFEVSLATKYETLKNEVLYNTPEAVSSRVLNSIMDTVYMGDLKSDEREAFIKKLGKTLETESANFIKNYKGDNLETDLKKHLNEYLNANDSVKMALALREYRGSAATKAGSYIDASELLDIKSAAKRLLTEALNNGVEVKLGGSKYTSLSALERKIDSYTDGQKLLDEVQAFIDSISSQSRIQQMKTNTKDEVLAEAEKQFTSIKGSSYQVDPTQLNYRGIPGYYDNEEYKVKGRKSQEKLSDQLETDIKEILDSTLKKQMKSQIQAMLLENGVPTNKIDTIFENIYNKSLTETLESGLIATRNKTAFRKGYAKCNIKDVVDTFIQTFNTNIATTIDAMNASSTDLDTVDLDMTKLGKGENGEDFSELYATGQRVTTKKRGTDYYVRIAEQIIEKLRSQLMIKAQKMCKANGVEFDAAAFNTMFANAKGTAIAAAVTGSGRINANAGKVSGVTATAAGAAGTVGAIVGSGTVTGVSFVSLSKGLIAISTMAGPIGWAAAGVAAVGTAIGMIIGGSHHSESTLDTQTLIDTFTEGFKETYTDWVNKEKTESKKK